MDKEQIQQEIVKKLRRAVGVTPADATPTDIYRAVSGVVRDLIMDRWVEANRWVREHGAKRLYYLSAEFLLGRALINSLINLDLYTACRDALAELGFDLDRIETLEPDAGLGNGGLGRLAACFLDSLSTLELPVTGCCIRYEHGMFRQQIEQGEQRELEDDWLESGNAWEIPRPEDRVEVRFGGHLEEVSTETGTALQHVDYESVVAYPYDMPVIGYQSTMPATLRLWEARAMTKLEMEHFNRGDFAKASEGNTLVEAISQVLYPKDDHEPGRILRLRQFYFLVSASMQFLINRYKERGGDLRDLPDAYTIQINDTHPALAIPELMRILIDQEGLSFDEAYTIATRMFNYTNHSIVSEALEKWDTGQLRELLPRIYDLVAQIDQRFRARLRQQWPDDQGKADWLAIIHDGQVYMANLCIAVCAKVNGVSQLHAQILKEQTFADYHTLLPDKFCGVTNGISFRRWLAQSDPGLTSEISSRIGSGFLKRFGEFEQLRDWQDNQELCLALSRAKSLNKERLARFLRYTQDVEIDPETMFDVQAKRLHEYKRQLLKALHILHLYYRLKDDPGAAVAPTTFLFAAKAAPGYWRAKEIIRLLCAVARLIDADPVVRKILKVVFVEDYNVSVAERLIPAADVSEQLSTAGLEASGTGNMKFMLNGAVTIGTMDGANIEIHDAVGSDNIFIFGAQAAELDRIREQRSYDPRALYESNPGMKRVLDTLISGLLPVSGDRQFHDLFNALLNEDGADRYFVLYDFDSYDREFSKLMAAYTDTQRWQQMSLKNTARAGYFSSDRAIQDYNDLIWHLRAVD
ncbi:MAG: glycogen/starch/alpha-glucan phosphorylase [Actinomycetia bacterium]|nr:glycogen/starch/alpha-glucan phosphorylase [Actinomycetes bacterium]